MTEIRVKITPLHLPHGPRETLARLRGDAHHALLESALTMTGQAQWSYVAGPARATLYTDAGGTHLERDGRIETTWSDPFNALAAVAQSRTVVLDCGAAVPAGLDFVGGWVGALGYDVARHVHRLPSLADAGPPSVSYTHLTLPTKRIV